jgi:hypothetical protein
MAGEFVGPPQYASTPAQYAPGVVVTPATPQGALPLAYAKPSIFTQLASLPRPVLIGGALLLAYVVYSSSKRR